MTVVLNPVLMYAVQNYVAGRPGQGLSLSNGFFVNPKKKNNKNFKSVVDVNDYFKRPCEH